MLKKLRIPILIVSIFIMATAYYLHMTADIPKKITQSNQTITNIDNVRFTFKISLMTQRGLSTYLLAIEEQDMGKRYLAEDYFSAAIGFLNTGYIQDPDFIDYVEPRLEAILALIHRYELSLPVTQISSLETLVQEIYSYTEQNERSIWHDIQKTYIEFRTHEYKIFQLYQILMSVSLIFLGISLALYWKQRQLLKLNRAHQQELQELAYYDPLTKISNRKNIDNILEKQLLRSSRHKSNFYIALIDIDNFKRVNDLLGHDAGDLLLIEFTERLNQTIRKEDFIGRLGGDEFLLIFDEDTRHDELYQILTRITEAFSQPVKISQTEFYVTFSIGVAQYPKDAIGKTPSQGLIKSADIAMYQAKQAGKNQFHFYDEQLGALIQHEHKMEVEIKQAIENDEFELYYQPQLDARTLQIIGAEALVRWNHPSGKLVMPNEFIGLIEKGYHTQAFGDWVITHAVQQQQAWMNQGMDIKVSINLSVKHIVASNFRQNILALMKRLNADLQRIVFEITEYELIAYQSNPIQDLKKLADAGFVFHLDDFGTGYSSISYLSQLPIKSIKIDKSFIDYIQADNHQKRMVEAIIHIAEALNIDIIAEGVETQYQVDYLNKQHCAAYQGYYFSKALPVDAFNRFVQTYQNPTN